MNEEKIGTTTKLLSHLAEHGPLTRRQLERLPFWGGVRSRLGDLIKQGRIIQCEIANPEPGYGRHAVVKAYKVPQGVFVGNIRLLRAKMTRNDKLKRRIDAAKKFLEENGYTVTLDSKGEE